MSTDTDPHVNLKDLKLSFKFHCSEKTQEKTLQKTKPFQCKMQIEINVYSTRSNVVRGGGTGEAGEAAASPDFRG